MGGEVRLRSSIGILGTCPDAVHMPPSAQVQTSTLSAHLHLQVNLDHVRDSLPGMVLRVLVPNSWHSQIEACGAEGSVYVDKCCPLDLRLQASRLHVGGEVGHIWPVGSPCLTLILLPASLQIPGFGPLKVRQEMALVESAQRQLVIIDCDQKRRTTYPGWDLRSNCTLHT